MKFSAVFALCCIVLLLAANIEAKRVETEELMSFTDFALAQHGRPRPPRRNPGGHSHSGRPSVKRPRPQKKHAPKPTEEQSTPEPSHDSAVSPSDSPHKHGNKHGRKHGNKHGHKESAEVVGDSTDAAAAQASAQASAEASAGAFAGASAQASAGQGLPDQGN